MTSRSACSVQPRHTRRCSSASGARGLACRTLVPRKAPNPQKEQDVNRIYAVLAALAVAALALLAPSSAAAAPEPRDGTVLVFGDSITAHHTADPGETMQGWWSILADRRNLTPIVSAQGGGAILKPGFGCYGSGIRDRFQAVVERTQPDEIWIASRSAERRVGTER